MGHDESDSSDADSDYTATNVLLGYASKDLVDDTFSQLGGKPIWPTSASVPSSAFARCKYCSGMMPLLLQLYADLPAHLPGHERRLYIFNCKRRACMRKEGSVRAIRGTKTATRTQKQTDEFANKKQDKTDDMQKTGQHQDAAPKLSKPKSMLGDSIFNSNFGSAPEAGQNPFAKHEQSKSERPLNEHHHHQLANPIAPASTGEPTSNDSTMAGPFANGHRPEERASSSGNKQTDPQQLATTFAQKARISSSTPTATPPQAAPAPKAPWPSESELPPPYPSYYLDADYESLAPSPPPSSSSASATKTSAMELDPTNSSANDIFDQDAFESSLDKTFQKFAGRVAQNADQVLRYEYGGQPLLYSATDAVGKLFHAPHQAEKKDVGVKTMGAKAKGMPKCTNCGAGRVFEVQLMPEAIAQLEVEEEGLDGMEWGTVLVGVCGKDCGEVGGEEGSWGWVEEWCGVQWEEVAKPGRP